MKSYEKLWKVTESSYNQLFSVILISLWCTSQIFWFGYLEALMCDQSETLCGHRFWNWSLTIRLRYSKEYITDGSNLSCFFLWINLDIWNYMGFKWSFNRKHDLSNPPTFIPVVSKDKISFLYPWKNFSVRWIQVTFLLRYTFSQSIWKIQIQMDSDGLSARNTVSESIWKIQIQMAF